MGNKDFQPEKLIVWLDDALLTVNKPAGLLTLPDGYDPHLPHLRGLLEPVYGRLWVVHRLDRETSGIVVLARTAEAHRALSLQFEKRETLKVYHALVIGAPPWQERTLKLRLRADGDRRHRTVIDHQKGKPATTRLRVLERFGRYALLEASPETGRTHQIRAHLASQGLQVVVDPLYGDGKGLFLSQIKPGYQPRASKEDRPLIGRLGLHAWSLQIRHPLSQESLLLEAPYPKDFYTSLRQLRMNAP